MKQLVYSLSIAMSLLFASACSTQEEITPTQSVSDANARKPAKAKKKATFAPDGWTSVTYDYNIPDENVIAQSFPAKIIVDKTHLSFYAETEEYDILYGQRSIDDLKIYDAFTGPGKAFAYGYSEKLGNVIITPTYYGYEVMTAPSYNGQSELSEVATNDWVFESLYNTSKYKAFQSGNKIVFQITDFISSTGQWGEPHTHTMEGTLLEYMIFITPQNDNGIIEKSVNAFAAVKLPDGRIVLVRHVRFYFDIIDQQFNYHEEDSKHKNK